MDDTMLQTDDNCPFAPQPALSMRPPRRGVPIRHRDHQPNRRDGGTFSHPPPSAGSERRAYSVRDCFSSLFTGEILERTPARAYIVFPAYRVEHSAHCAHHGRSVAPRAIPMEGTAFTVRSSMDDWYGSPPSGDDGEWVTADCTTDDSTGSYEECCDTLDSSAPTCNALRTMTCVSCAKRTDPCGVFCYEVDEVQCDVPTMGSQARNCGTQDASFDCMQRYSMCARSMCFECAMERNILTTETAATCTATFSCFAAEKWSELSDIVAHGNVSTMLQDREDLTGRSGTTCNACGIPVGESNEDEIYHSQFTDERISCNDESSMMHESTMRRRRIELLLSENGIDIESATMGGSNNDTTRLTVLTAMDMLDRFDRRCTAAQRGKASLDYEMSPESVASRFMHTCIGLVTFELFRSKGDGMLHISPGDTPDKKHVRFPTSDVKLPRSFNYCSNACRARMRSLATKLFEHSTFTLSLQDFIHGLQSRVQTIVESSIPFVVPSLEPTPPLGAARRDFRAVLRLFMSRPEITSPRRQGQQQHSAYHAAAVTRQQQRRQQAGGLGGRQPPLVAGNDIYIGQATFPRESYEHGGPIARRRPIIWWNTGRTFIDALADACARELRQAQRWPDLQNAAMSTTWRCETCETRMECKQPHTTLLSKMGQGGGGGGGGGQSAWLIGPFVFCSARCYMHVRQQASENAEEEYIQSFVQWNSDISKPSTLFVRIKPSIQ